MSSVDSFLALGELCQNLIRVTKIIEKGGDSPIIQNVLDFGVFSNFRDKLETIKAKCVAMARNCLESGESHASRSSQAGDQSRA